MRRFDACALCLQRVREPLACNEGHLFCKECVYTDLREQTTPTHFSPSLSLLSPVSQKRDIKRQKDKLEALKREADEERDKAKEAARERVLLDFERSQLALAGGPIAAMSKSTEGTGSSSDGESPHSVPFPPNATKKALLRLSPKSQRNEAKICFRCISCRDSGPRSGRGRSSPDRT